MCDGKPILIAGAGLGGLCAASGLRRAGHDVVVLERDASLDARAQGYRLNLDPAGDGALRSCLPPAHHRLVTDTAHRQLDPSVDVFAPDLRLLLHRDADPGSTADVPPSAVNRATLRRILADAAGDVRFGTAVTGVTDTTSHALVETSDGQRIPAGLVVAADGAGSVLRERVVPGPGPEPLGQVAIYGRAPLPDPLTWLPRGVVDQRFVGVTDGAGTTLALGAWNPRRPPAEAAAEHGVRLDAPDPYVMWVLIGPTDALPAPGAPAGELWRFARTAVSGWAPAATRFVDAAIVADTFGLTLRAMPRVPDWPAGRVTFLGDAIHAMSPAGGEGANTALADAAALVDALAGGVTPAAIADYESGLRQRARSALERSRAYGQPRERAA